MLARRFLWIIVGIVMLALAAAFGYRMFGEQLLKAAMVPSVPFAESKQDSKPDYRRPAMWLSRPDLPDDPARWAPEGYDAADRDRKRGVSGKSGAVQVGLGGRRTRKQKKKYKQNNGKNN